MFVTVRRAGEATILEVIDGVADATDGRSAALGTFLSECAVIVLQAHDLIDLHRRE
jgi:hypothetical protein